MTFPAQAKAMHPISMNTFRWQSARRISRARRKSAFRLGQKGRTLVVLLCGGDKRTQDRDIRLAKQYWREFKAGDL